MKIYFDINEENLISFRDYIKREFPLCIEFLLSTGTYCLDNTNERLEGPLGDAAIAAIPKSFILSWDEKHIDDLYKNRIIGRFNEGKLKWTLEDPMAMAPMIRVLMYGMEKYDRDNWKKACPKRLDLMDSLERHCKAIIAGESVDPESGLPHIGHLMCNAMFYSYWEQKTNGQFENMSDK